MENEDKNDPAKIEQNPPSDIGEEQSDREGKLDSASPAPKTFFSRFRELMTLTYMRLIFIALVTFFLAWLGLTTCSSPNLAKKHYFFAIDPSWYPLELRGKGKNMTAYAEMLFRQIAQMENLNVDIVRLSTSRLFREFEEHRVDGVISVLLPPLQAKEKPYLVSDPIFRLGLVLVVGANKPAESLADMKGKIVGLVGNARTTLNIDLYPDVIFYGFSEASQAIVDLSNNRIDGLIMDGLMAKSYSQGFYAGKFYILKTPLSSEGISLILHKSEESKKFLELFNSQLKKLRENGELSNLFSAWQLSEE